MREAARLAPCTYTPRRAREKSLNFFAFEQQQMGNWSINCCDGLGLPISSEVSEPVGESSVWRTVPDVCIRAMLEQLWLSCPRFANVQPRLGVDRRDAPCTYTPRRAREKSLNFFAFEQQQMGNWPINCSARQFWSGALDLNRHNAQAGFAGHRSQNHHPGTRSLPACPDNAWQTAYSGRQCALLGRLASADPSLTLAHQRPPLSRSPWSRCARAIHFLDWRQITLRSRPSMRRHPAFQSSLILWRLDFRIRLRAKSAP